jgi:hypothetical protein
MTDAWTWKDTIIVIIGIITSFFVAVVYEMMVEHRNKKKLRKKYSFLQSNENEFDWQTWKINNGKIAESPINSYMTLKYHEGKMFSFKWKDDDAKEGGEGYIFWDEIFYGKMSFFEGGKSWFDNRNVFYTLKDHQEIKYDAIYVDAKDQGTTYVMLRPKVISTSF